ncbi:hypothetical protein ACHQM5_018546 [Ranunculus cassubicifolius]
MAAISSFVSTTQFSISSLGFQPFKSPNPNFTLISPISSSKFSRLRVSNNGSLQVKERRFTVLVKAGEGDVIEKKSEINGNDNPQGPPIATILAGFVVFGIVFWFIGTILSWLVGLIVNAPPST